MTNLNEMKVAELKEMAKELKVKNWWTLKKADLIDGIVEALDESESTEEVTNDEVIVEESEATQNEPETTEDKVGEKKQRGKDLIEYDGKVQNLSQWAKELGMPGQTLFARIHLSGWTVEKAFTTPVKKRNKKEEEA